MSKSNFLRHKWIIYSVLVIVIFSITSSNFAFAYDNSTKMMDISYDWLDIGNSITGIISANLFLRPALSFLSLAGEFFNTISGNNLFTAGIDASNFTNVYNFVGNLCNALRPIGFYFVGICCGIEGLRIAKDSKGLSTQWMGLGVLESWLVFAIKFYVLYTIVKNAKAFMLCIYSLVMMIQKVVQNAISTAGLGNASVVFSDVENYINNLTLSDGMGACFTVMIVCLVVLGVCALTAVYVQILSVMRLFEIFILMAVSPVTLATGASSLTSDVTRIYIKTFISAVLQLSVILIIVAIFGPLIGGITQSLNEVFAQGTGIGTLLKAVIPIVTSLSLFLMVKQSRQMADKMVGL